MVSLQYCLLCLLHHFISLINVDKNSMLASLEKHHCQKLFELANATQGLTLSAGANENNIYAFKPHEAEFNLLMQL